MAAHLAIVTDKCHSMPRVDGAATEPALFQTHFEAAGILNAGTKSTDVELIL